MVGHAPKSVSRDEPEDEVMGVDDSSGTLHVITVSRRECTLTAPIVESSISLVLPPSLPKCQLTAKFRCSDTNADIPPAFYPGQAIPTILTFQLDRYYSLPHSLNPVLTMSLVGTLHIPNAPPRTIICVSVSLAEGLELWSRDAQQAYASRPPRDCLVDPKTCLPGGTYSLPLTVQVPSTPRLPPSFTVAGATFAVTYALSVTLACDDPQRAGSKVVLAEAVRAFEMMPETMPTRTPRYNPQSFWVRTDGTTTGGVVGTAKGLVRRPNSRWTIEPFLPTTAFSPTSVIPLRIRLTPPAETDCSTHQHQVIIRLAIMRREHSSLAANAHDPSSGHSGLVNEEEISSRFTWLESLTPATMDIQTILPVMDDNTWTHGFSTMLNVGPPSNSTTEVENISVSSTFHLAVTLAFLPITPGGPTLDKVLDRPLPAAGTFTESHDILDLITLKRNFPGTIRTLPLPIVIGSVSEPRSAMHNIRWSDLHLDRSSGREIGRMISGEALSCEDGWIMAPPAYSEAIKTVPYDYL